MSLIIYQQNTLKNTAVVILKNSTETPIITTENDLTIMTVDGVVTGINISNADKHMELKQGAHTVSQEQFIAIEKMGLNIENRKSSFAVGTVLERKEHPKSKKLFVLKILVNKELQIVTNSLTAIVGKQVVVAKVGATLPSGTPIKLSKVMNVKSEGMLVGGKTLQIPNSEDGVLLIDNAKNGEEFLF